MSAAAGFQVIDDDLVIEPVPGLPEVLPPGERVLWSGVPDWRAVALDVFHMRAIGLYALVLVAWRALAVGYDGGSAREIVIAAAILGGVFAAGLALIAFLAWATATTTRYTVTNRRVVLRIGVALTLTVNLPFAQVKAAHYRPAPFRTGAIALELANRGGLGYAVLWPHARPFHFSRPQPMLRGIKDGERVARMLGAALVAANGTESPTIHVGRAPAAGEPVAA